MQPISSRIYVSNSELRIRIAGPMQGILETFEVIQENNHLYGSERIKWLYYVKKKNGYRNSLSNSPCPLGRARGRGLI